MSRVVVVLSALALAFGLVGVGVVSPPTAVAASTGVAVDPGFVPAGGLAGSLEAAVVQSDGKAVIGGSFEAVGGVARSSLARLNVDGTLDATFNPGTGPTSTENSTTLPGTVSALAVQPDGKVLVAGWFDAFGGVARPGLVRLNANGSVDTGFNPGSGPVSAGSVGSIQVIRVAADGTIMVGGHFDTFNAVARNGIVRLTAAGAVDATFNPGTGVGAGEVVTIAILGNSTMVIGGDFTEFNGVPRASLARLLANGALDPGFNPGTGAAVDIGGSESPGKVTKLAVRTDGKVVVGGWFTAFSGVARASLVQLTPTGAVDATFGGATGFEAEGYQPWVNDLVLQADGKVVVGGDFDAFQGQARPKLARLTATGGLDATFVPSGGGPGGGASVNEVVLQSDGRVLVVGDFENFGGAVRAGLARVSAAGALDAGYSPLATRGRGFNGDVAAVLVEPGGKLLIGGAFSSYNGTPRRGIARLNPDGTLDDAFNPGGGTTSVLDGSPAVTTLTRQSDGKVLVGGWFTEFDGIARNGVLRLNADGTLDSGFDPGNGVAGLWEGYGTVNALTVQADGKILVGGWFTSMDGVDRNGIARLNPDGTHDVSFDPGSGFLGPEFAAPVQAIGLTADGKILVGGAFERADGLSRPGLARLLPDGTVDTGFNPGTGFVADEWGNTGTVNVIAQQPDGRVLVGGDFISVNGTARGSIARLNPDGSLDAGFATGAGFANSAFSAVVWSVHRQPDGSLLVGGEFDSFNGVARVSMARLTAAGAPDDGFRADLGAFQPVKSLAVQPDGKIVVGGRFVGFGDAFPTPVNIMRLVPKIDPPGAPTGLAATAGDGTAAVAFTPPASAGGAPITNYEYSLNGGAWKARNPASTASPLVLTSLANGTTYQVRLRAVNSAGPGAESVAVPVTPTAPVASVFVPVTPARVLDTRVSQGGQGPLAAGQTQVFPVAATQAGAQPVVPAGAVAIAYNLTVPGPAGAGHVRLMPGDAPGLTSASAINFRPGETIANAAVVKIDSQRRVKAYAAAPADLIIDVVGYFVPANAGSAAGKFTAVTPVRVYDSADDAGGLLQPGTARVVSTATTQDGASPVVPAGASAVAYTLTVVRPNAAGHLRVMPGNVASSPSSAINWSVPGDVIANGSTVQVDAQRRMKVFSGASGPVRFLVDVVGYYSANGASFYPTDPARVSDSRTSQGGAGSIGSYEPGVRVVPVAATQAGGMQVVPTGATAIAYNLTGTGTGSAGHLRAYPASEPVAITASVLNWPGAGYTRANGTVVAISTNRQIKLYNGSGSPVDAVVDVLGYYR